MTELLPLLDTTAQSHYCIGTHDFVRRAVDHAASTHRNRRRNLPPDALYGAAVEDRALQLVDAVESLNVVESLLAMRPAPTTSGQPHIAPPEWIRVTLEVLSSRLRSIRDSLLLVVAGVFELRLLPRDATLKNVLPLVSNPTVATILGRANDIVLARTAAAPPTPAAPCNATAQSDTEAFSPESGTEGIHAQVVAGVHARYHERSDALVEATSRLLDALLVEFETRLRQKRVPATATVS